MSGKLGRCKNGWTITSRYVLENEEAIYFVTSTNSLVRHRWAAIQAGDLKTFDTMHNNVEDFCLRKDGPLVLTKDGKLLPPLGNSIDLIAQTGVLKWGVAESIGSRSVCAGELDSGRGVLVTVGKTGSIRGSIELPLQNNGHCSGILF